MKSSLGISNFLEEISSLSHSVVFLYFFALVTEEGFFLNLSSLFFGVAISIALAVEFSFTSRQTWVDWRGYLLMETLDGVVL